MGRAAEWVKDNAVGIASIFVTLASGAGSLWLDAAGMVKEHPLASVLLAVASGFLGYFFGWLTHDRATKRRARRKQAEAKREQAEAKRAELRGRISKLDGEQIELLMSAYDYGLVRCAWRSRENDLMEGMAYMGLVSGHGGTVWTWRLNEACRQVLGEMAGDGAEVGGGE